MFQKIKTNCGALHRLIVASFCIASSTLVVSAQTNFATLTPDGAWTWYNDHRALFHNGKLYFGYVRAADSKTALSVFDVSTGLGSNLWVSGFTQLDDHNNPGLLSKQDGRLLAAYARHISDQYFSYRTSSSTNPVSSSGWNAEINIPNSGAGMTYANPFQLSAESGKIYNFCRNQNFNPTIYTSTDGGTNWSSPQLFIQAGAGGTVRPYVKYASDNSSRVDFLYTDGHPRDIANSLYHLYYSGGAFYKTDGTLVKNYAALPILHDSAERGSVIYQYSDAPQADANEWIPTGRAWCWETAYQSNGAPVCVFTVQNDFAPVGGTDSDWTNDRIYYYYARWTGTNWQKRFIAQAGRPLYSAEDDYAGGICVDPVEPNVIYISSNAQNPFNLADTTNVTLSASQRYELWRGVTSDGGLTFAWSQVTSNSTVDNLRPYVPRRNGGERCVLWVRGSYSSYTSYATAIVGLFTTPVPVKPKISYIESTTGAAGNTAFAAGSVFSPGTAASGTDGLWRLRTLGNLATTFESGGDISTAGSAAGGNNENAPRLATTITNLVPHANYDVYVYFWNANAQDWRIRAGFTNSGGDLALFTAAASPNASSGDFVAAPLLAESDRVMKQAYLGTATANATGTIVVYTDDDPASRASVANGWQMRTWFDGVGVARISPATNAPSLSMIISNSILQLSWPVTHLGWRLESQTNLAGVGLDGSWAGVAGSALVNQFSAPIDPAHGNVLFRLAYP